MLENAVNGVILEHVREIIRIEKIVDADHFDVIREVLDRSTEHHATDTAEPIDTNLDSHFLYLFSISPPRTLPSGKFAKYYTIFA